MKVYHVTWDQLTVLQAAVNKIGHEAKGIEPAGRQGKILGMHKIATEVIEKIIEENGVTDARA